MATITLGFPLHIYFALYSYFKSYTLTAKEKFSNFISLVFQGYSITINRIISLSPLK